MNTLPAALLTALLLTCSAAAATFDITDYGAVGDGKTLNTGPLQAAIDACGEAGGGTVRVPNGTWLFGTIFLRDNVRLYLAPGATLLGSTDRRHLNPRHLIVADGVRNVAIEGRGTLDAQGENLWLTEPPEAFNPDEAYRWAEMWNYWRAYEVGRPIVIREAERVIIRDLTIRDSPEHTLVFEQSRDILVDNLRIRNPLWGLNTDGIQVMGCEDVRISNCDIITGDDAIVLKSEAGRGGGRWVRNVTVTNCTIVTATNGFKCGTGSVGGFERITFSNSTITADTSKMTLRTISGVSLMVVDGGTLRDVTVSNVTMQGMRAPFFIRLGNRGTGQDEPVPGTVHNLTLSNIIARGAFLTPTITGLPGHRVRDVLLSDIQLIPEGGGTAELADVEVPYQPARYPEANMFGRLPSYGLFMRHAEGVVVRNWIVETQAPDARPFLYARDAPNLVVDGLRVRNAAETPAPFAVLRETEDAVLDDVYPKPDVLVAGE